MFLHDHLSMKERNVSAKESAVCQEQFQASCHNKFFYISTLCKGTVAYGQREEQRHMHDEVIFICTSFLIT